ncbi:MAG: hypothetical protein RBU23_08655 [Candidatus Auribacterota bacterium]|jgi:hypothetical protein|nr:hypothetical protein [Candidatus Auribacterota bacterium]
MKEIEARLKKNLQKVKKFLRTGHIVPAVIVKVLNDRDVIIKIRGISIKAYTNLPFTEGDHVHVYVVDSGEQLRLKFLSQDEYKRLTGGGIDYTI